MAVTFNVTLHFAPGQDVDCATFENVRAGTAEVWVWARRMADQMGLKLRDNPGGWTPAIMVSPRRRRA
jgi:hypothetical protein